MEYPREEIKEKNLMNTQTAESLLMFVEEVGPGIWGLESQTIFRELDQRHDELLAGIEWFIAQGRTDKSLRFAISLAPFWMATKRLDEGTTWFEQVLAMPGGDNAQRGRALFDAGMLTFWRGDDARAATLYNQSLEMGQRINHPTVMALALSGLARVALRTDVAQAERLCRQALAVIEGTDDRAGRSSASHVLAVAAQMAGDFPLARKLMTERIALGRAAGNYALISAEAGNLSMVERQLGNLDAAEALAREALEIDYQRGDAWSMPHKVSGLAAVAMERGAFEHAAILIGAAEAMMEAEGAAWPPDERVHYENTVASLTAAIGLADFERARMAGFSMTTPEAVHFALEPRPETLISSSLSIKL
jgi:tetratricopeptide (TPR) repeat protein